MSESIRGWVWRVGPEASWEWAMDVGDPSETAQELAEAYGVPSSYVEILPAILLVEPEPVGWTTPEHLAKVSAAAGDEGVFWPSGGKLHGDVPLYALEEAGNGKE